MTDALPTYRQLFELLRQRGVDPEVISMRLGTKSNGLHYLRVRDRADPDDERYRRLFRLARSVRAAYGTTTP